MKYLVVFVHINFVFNYFKIKTPANGLQPHSSHMKDATKSRSDNCMGSGSPSSAR